jgi:hypothetical protein
MFGRSAGTKAVAKPARLVRIRDSLIERVLARAAVCAGWALIATLGRRMTYADPAADPYRSATQGIYIYSVWHDSLLMPLFLGRQPQTVGLHQDGTFLMHSLAAQTNGSSDLVAFELSTESRVQCRVRPSP